MTVVHKSNKTLPGLYIIEAAASTNDPFAVWFLGNLHSTGEGGFQSNTRAFELFEKAANLSSIAGMRSAALCLRYGLGVDVDLARSLLLWTKAAQAGCVRSQYEVGLMHLRGSGTPKDRALARQYLNLAAMNGSIAADAVVAWIQAFEDLDLPANFEDAFEKAHRAPIENDDAQLALGLHIEASLSAPGDLWQAVDCYASLVERKNIDAQFHFGRLITEKPGLRGFAFRKGFDALLSAANSGHVRAMVLLAEILSNGYTDDGCYIACSRSEATRWYTMAAEAGDLTAKSRLLLLAPVETYSPKDYRNFIASLIGLANDGSNDARLMLHLLAGSELQPIHCGNSPYLRSYISKHAPFESLSVLNSVSTLCLQMKDLSSIVRHRSLFWLWHSAYNGSGTAQKKLGEILSEGKICERDYGQAIFWLKRAALAGEKGAGALVGDLLNGTSGIMPNFAEAAKFYRMEIAHENPYCARRLAHMYYRGLGVEYSPTLGDDMVSLAQEWERRTQAIFDDLTSIESSLAKEQTKILSIAEYRREHKAS